MAQAASLTRPPAVAGSFYPGDAAALRRELAALLDAAQAQLEPASVAPKIVIVPHAGYGYSGAIAARAYAQLKPFAAGIQRIVLLGPVHRVPVRGLAAPTVNAFETPLGRIAIDRAALWPLKALPQVVFDDRPHAPEHSLEVQLPFLQAVFGAGFSLVPLAVGDAKPSEVAAVIEKLWGGPETLIVISTDLSHYHPYAEARTIDRRTAERIGALATDLDPHEACGARALNGALLAAAKHGLRPRLLDLRNSGDTAGDKQRVVGYAAWALTADAEPNLGAALLARARNAISRRLGAPLVPEPAHPQLAERGATFVTLHDARGQLRGCIGRLQAIEGLDADVRHNAVQAAFADPRFPPVNAAEWPTLALEVSLLSAPEPLPPAASEADALRSIAPGIDGLILEWRGHRATFLPQVWEQLPKPSEFMAALKRKAGLAADFWAPDVKLERYRARKFK
jgi:hypothetical protein